MLRNLTALTLAICFAGQAHAQFQWNGPYNGGTFWSAGVWSPSVPPAGGGAGTSLTFTQLGGGAFYSAINNLGNPFVLTTLNLAGGGGDIAINSSAGNTLEFVGSAAINQTGIGNAVINSSATLTAGTTTIGGTNFGNVQLSGILSGGGGILIDRMQTLPYTSLVDLTAANTFAGGVTLQRGTLHVGNATALGTGTLTLTGGSLGASTPSTIANPVTLNGADFVYSGGIMTLTSAISQVGTRGLTLSNVNPSTLTLQGTNTYSGPTNSVVNPQALQPVATTPFGTLILSGANGSANLSSQFNFSGGSNFTLNNSAVGANNNNRIGDNAPVNISGGTFLLVGANGGATVENIGALSGSGSVTVTLNAATAGNAGTTLQADSLNRINRAQFFFGGVNLGSPLGANVPNLIFDTAPVLSGGGGGPGTLTISIIPYAFGAGGLVTYGANGVRALSFAAFETTTSIANGTTTLNNVRTATPHAITAPTQINALQLDTATPFTGSTSTLTLASGTLIIGTSGALIPAAMTLNFGSIEGNVFTLNSMTVDGVLTGTNGLSKAGAGNLNLNNVNNNLTGQLTINEGFIGFTDPAALSSVTNIVVNGRAHVESPGLNLNGAGNATVAKSMAVTDGFARLSSSGGTLNYSGAIGGAGGVLINGGNVELTNTNNSYAGQTRVAILGNLLVSGDNVLGNGGGVHIAGNTTTGLRLTGPWTTSRQINMGGQIDTNGFDWTVNSPLTGGGIFKVGAGVWTLSQAGSAGGTITVSAGELRATNPTGSATGTATINSTGTSILSGTGRFGGPTFIASTASLRPGIGGTTVGTLGFGNTLSMTGAYNVDGAGTVADQFNVLGDLTFNSGSVLNLSGTFNPSTTFTLATYASRSGTFTTVNGLPATHFLMYNPTSLQLVPVPEPAAILAVAGLSLAIGHRIRRRRSRR